MRLPYSAIAVFCALAMSSSALLPVQAQGNVTYKPAPEATLKYGDGVTVHRHADGSVEVSDTGTTESWSADQPRSVRRVAHRKAVRRKASVKKTITSKKG